MREGREHNGRRRRLVYIVVYCSSVFAILVATFDLEVKVGKR